MTYFLWEQLQSSLAGEIAGPSSYPSKNPDILLGGLKIFQENPFYNNIDDYAYEAFEEDYGYDEDEYDDYDYDSTLYESEYNFTLASKFDGLDIPPGVEAPLPWLQTTAAEMANKTKPVNMMDDKIDEKYSAFKQFDTVDDHSDHYYSKPDLRKVQVVKKVTFFLYPLYIPFLVSSILSFPIDSLQKNGQSVFSTSGKF